MPFSVPIIHYQEFYLPNEIQSTITTPSNSYYPCLTFVTKPICSSDEVLTCPSKFLLYYGNKFIDLVTLELEKLGYSNQYKALKGIEWFHIKIELIYVINERIEKLHNDEMKKYKMMKCCVAIKKRE